MQYLAPENGELELEVDERGVEVYSKGDERIVGGMKWIHVSVEANWRVPVG